MGDTKEFARETEARGIKNRVVGAFKEGVSKLTGNKSGEAEGTAQRTYGQAQQNVGETANDMADETRKRA